MRIEVVGVPKGPADASPAAMETPLMVAPIYTLLPVRSRGLLGLPVVAALDRRAGGVLERALAQEEMDRRGLARAFARDGLESKDGEWVEGSGHGGPGPERIRFVSMGQQSNRIAYRNLAGRAVRAAEEHGAASLALCVSHARNPEPGYVASALAEGLVMAAWRFDEFKSDPVRYRGRPAPPVESAVVLVPEEDLQEWSESVRRGVVHGQAANLTRTLQARPGNVATPTHLAEEAEKIAREAGLECTILGPEELERERMRALLAVARGSDEEPRMIVLRHSGGDPDDQPLALVGKGLTFDAGGISIKPAKGMEDMKYDMSGGAAVLGAMWGVGRLGLSCNVVGIVPCAENLLGGSATKPGDIVVARSGKSVEVINTDAEGRLILADALDYATETNPKIIVDCATLTGASVVALGHTFSAAMGNDPWIVDQLAGAGDQANEPCWHLPMADEYRSRLDSDCADLKNVGGRAAGAITAACFLSEFVQEIPWVHLDVAGTAYGKTKKPYLRDGPLGNPCRLLLSWLEYRSRSA